MPIVSFPMPFPTVTATFWPPTYGTADAYGNPTVTYDTTDKVETAACFAPAATTDEMEDGKPHGDVVELDLYLPKDFATDIRGALVTLATGDAVIDALTFRVDGSPVSYMRDATPGDYSWVVRVVEHVG